MRESCFRSVQEAAAYEEEWTILLRELEEEILEYLERERELIDYRTPETEP